MEQINWIQSIIEGVVQGLSEFLPISSSGHLIVTRQLFNIPDPGKTFDILMHLGTLIALVVYFWSDLTALAKGFWADARQGKLYGTKNTGMVWFMVVSTIPGGLFGALFNEKLEEIRNVYLISILLIVFGLVLFAADRWGKKARVLDDLTLKDAVLIGIAQALALFPGVSRSGVTMTTAMFLGFDRESSARYSFLISIPLIGGISAYGLLKLIKSQPDGGQAMVYFLGLLASAASGFLCIKFLLNYLKKGGFTGFVIYRAALGAILIILGILGLIKVN
jgi:undecaprenyl-diphosphatase